MANIAVDRSRTSRARFVHGATRPNMIIGFLLLCLLEGYVMVRASSKDCYGALSDCNEDTKCSRKLSHYAKECGTIVDVSTSFDNATRFPCSKSCVNSIKTLMQTKKGKALWKCDCKLGAHCLTLKSRTEKCLAIANGTYRKRTGCTAVLYTCMTDSKCKKMQMEFLAKCYQINVKCTRDCLRSQKRLFSLPVGKPLMDCECDGVNELYCLVFRAYANLMKCNWGTRRRRRRYKNRQRKRRES